MSGGVLLWRRLILKMVVLLAIVGSKEATALGAPLWDKTAYKQVKYSLLPG